MNPVLQFIKDHYEKGKRIVNFMTWAVIIIFFVYMELIRADQIDDPTIDKMVKWASAFYPFFVVILGLRVAGGTVNKFMEKKNGAPK